jgi:hypothetical protein
MNLAQALPTHPARIMLPSIFTKFFVSICAEPIIATKAFCSIFSFYPKVDALTYCNDDYYPYFEL